MSMDLALAEAARALTLSRPNPRVGCVLVNGAGRVLGRGHTQQTGGPHAEIVALRDAYDRGHDTAGATAYVTLEPCSHQGRTAPCCEALIRAGIVKVVAAVEDPNPLVCGHGFARLRAAGITVETGPGGDAARELNIGFFSRMLRGMPWVRMKIAASLDGRTALESGLSQWITSEPSRADGHAWRARACAVLTGIGTVLEDNPRLDVREVSCLRQPDVVLVDSRLELPLTARLLQPPRRLWVYTAVPPETSSRNRTALQSRGVTVISLPNAIGKVDLPAMLRDLAAREINEVHVEAGTKLNGSLAREALVDEFLVYLAPKLLGAGRSMAELGTLPDLAAALPLTFTSVTTIGDDLRITARPRGRQVFT